MVILLAFNVTVMAQIEARWLAVGSMHNFYTSNGVEREHALVSSQQYGLRWPAIFQFQDMQAAKAMWIGANNFTDENGVNFEKKVVHVGPRVSGANSFYTTDMKTVSRFAPPVVSVDGIESFQLPLDNDEVDPNMDADRMIVNTVNSALGLTMERRIMQFSQEFHDNYHVMEYTFTNTGNVNDNSTIELPSTTLEDVYIFFQWRYSVVRQTRYVIGNATGWGLNAMVDRFGDGVGPDYGTDGTGIRGHFVWHGKFPQFTTYDNIGGPIWVPNTVNGFLEPSDSTGRLGAYHFVGNAVIHADTSPSDPTDDLTQPRTMSQVPSDDRLNSGNDPFNRARMIDEYALMATGRTNRHAYLVEPGGPDAFVAPTRDPSLGTSGGWSASSGFGPYTIAPGESIRIVIAEGASGISRIVANETGAAFKAGDITALEKNQVVFQGRDSLMQTFMRTKANFDGGYNLPREPRPPSVFNINSGGDGIYLDWEYPDSEVSNITGFRIYRANTRYDNLDYFMIGEVGPNVREFEDTDNTPVTVQNPEGGPSRGRDYFYYIQAVGTPALNTGAALTPAGELLSSRYYTQSYDAARLQRPAGESMSDIRIVPNPFVISAASEIRLGRRAEARLAFYEIPGRAKISIYTELGELIRTIEHTDGSGDTFWDLNTNWRQRISSGVYIAVIENLETGEVATRKFVVVF